MFWVGLIIALIGGFLEIPPIQNFLKGIHPTITDSKIHITFAILLIIGLAIQAITYISGQTEIETLKEIVDYQDIASYNANGNKSGAINGIRMVPTPVDDWNKEFVVRQDGRIVCKCSSLAINKSREIIDKFPTYPFSYYFLALCLRENAQQSWKDYAIKAKLILERTTKIPSHHSDHDLILNEINRLFSDLKGVNHFPLVPKLQLGNAPCRRSSASPPYSPQAP